MFLGRLTAIYERDHKPGMQRCSWRSWLFQALLSQPRLWLVSRLLLLLFLFPQTVIYSLLEGLICDQGDLGGRFETSLVAQLLLISVKGHEMLDVFFPVRPVAYESLLVNAPTAVGNPC